MVYEQVAYRISFVLFGEDADRVKIEYDEYDELVLIVDVHGYTVKEAKKVIDGVFKVINVSFTFRLIHGYNHGTKLKEYIHNEFINNRVVEKYCYPNNPGETFLTVVEEQ